MGTADACCWALEGRVGAGRVGVEASEAAAQKGSPLFHHGHHTSNNQRWGVPVILGPILPSSKVDLSLPQVMEMVQLWLALGS